MKSYSEVEGIFTPAMIFHQQVAAGLVRVMPTFVTLEYVRCHEVARAALRLLTAPRYARFKALELSLYDGVCHGVEHSWIGIRDGQASAVLDVYAPGRHPQVQLIALAAGCASMYREGERRTDIDETLVDTLVQRCAHVVSY